MPDRGQPLRTFRRIHLASQRVASRVDRSCTLLCSERVVAVPRPRAATRVQSTSVKLPQRALATTPRFSGARTDRWFRLLFSWREPVGTVAFGDASISDADRMRRFA